MMVVLCANVLLGVFSRYFIGRTFTWYDEIARLLFVWIVFLGAAVGVRRGVHFRLHLLVDRFPPVAIQQGWKLVEFGQFPFVLLLALRVPVAFVIGVSGFVGIRRSGEYPLSVIVKQIFEGIESFVLLAIPLFILAGALMETGGIAARLVRLAQVLVGWIRGGLSMALPTFMPVVTRLGIDVVHYGTVMVAATGIGLFLPPLGVGFFIACSVARIRGDRATPAMMPYVYMMCAGLLV